MFPSAPPLHLLHLARLADLPRIGVVAAAGFYHSPVFAYERPFGNDFPNDTLASYRHMYQKAIVDPNAIVLVAKDVLNKSEADAVYPALASVYPSWSDQLPSDNSKDGKAIVGVVSVSLQEGSARHGQFQPDGNPTIPEDPERRDRDRNRLASKLLNDATLDIQKELFAGHIVIDTVVVHPAYWQRRHASDLLQWFMELAKEDHVGAGVEAARSGVPLFKHIGFKEDQTVVVPGYRDHPDTIEVWFGLNELAGQDDMLKVQL